MDMAIAAYNEAEGRVDFGTSCINTRIAWGVSMQSAFFDLNAHSQ